MLRKGLQNNSDTIVTNTKLPQLQELYDRSPDGLRAYLLSRNPDAPPDAIDEFITANFTTEE